MRPLRGPGGGTVGHMTLPFDPPLDPMLAKVAPGIPTDEGWGFEPKWDGFRALAFADPPEVRIDSRDGRDLQRYFPEVHRVLKEQVSEPCVLDGEVIVPTEDGLDFDLLLQRIHPAASRVKLLSEQTPATFVCFDLLARRSKDLRAESTRTRRAELLEVVSGDTDAESVATGAGPAIVATDMTLDRSTAESWFVDLENMGLDGIIAKRLDGAYEPGKRVMLKIKHRRTADCVIGGFRRHKSGDGVGSLLLGVYDDAGVLHYIGFTSSFKAPFRRELEERLRPLETDPEDAAFGAGRTPGAPSRWTSGKETSWIAVKPTLVCEVAYDHMQAVRFRHGAKWLRWRPDKPPRECTFDQIPPRHRP
jgi:ATP-dependent DNA ligase